MASRIQRGMGTFKITSVVRAACPSILRRNVPERADRGRVVAGALVLEVITVDRCHDYMLQPHPLRGLRQPQRLQWIGRSVRLAGMDVAVAAGTRARVAEDLEGSGATAPALGDVRAAGLLADRMQARAVDEVLDLEVARLARRCPDL